VSISEVRGKISPFQTKEFRKTVGFDSRRDRWQSLQFWASLKAASIGNLDSELAAARWSTYPVIQAAFAFNFNFAV